MCHGYTGTRVHGYWITPHASGATQRWSERLRTPEFTGKALDQWAHENGEQIKRIQPGKPTRNASIESFNGKVRDECLNESVLKNTVSGEESRSVVMP